MAQTQAEVRGDLIRRLFAVAISVGAASTLARMGWVKDGHWPDLGEWQQLSILTAAMTATVLSWDGYLMSVQERPLTTFWRFAIDIALVFIYMFLLMTSHHKTWWLQIHAWIYVLYAFWDVLTVREYPEAYSTEKVRKPTGQVYWNGLRDADSKAKGPIITLLWGLYFWLLYFLNYTGLEHRIFITSIFAVIGLVLYRRDKRLRYTMTRRLLAIFGLLAASWLYLKFGSAFEDEEIFSVSTQYAIQLFVLLISVAVLGFCAIIFSRNRNPG